jgi:hypothetical protein
MALPFFPDRLYYLWFFGLPLLSFLIILSIIVKRKTKKSAEKEV